MKKKVNKREWHDYVWPILSTGIIAVVLYVFYDLTMELIDTTSSIFEPYVVVSILLWFILAKEIFRNIYRDSCKNIDDFFDRGEDK